MTVEGSPVDDESVAPAFPDGWNWFELPETDGMALLAWAVGPDYVVRWRDRSDVPPVRTRIRSSDGSVQEFYSERTRTDQAEVDLHIDRFLAEAGVPHQPSGYRWFVVLPPGWSEQHVWSMMDRAEHEATRSGHSPVRLHEGLRREASALHSSPPEGQPSS
ncbi:DUF5956 family protein [Streptomonospora sediminis]